MKTNRDLLLETLIHYGLSDKEALVYLTSLEIGPSTVLKRPRLCGVKRSTVYLTVDNLIKKGLMSIEIKGLKKSYKAENPDHLEAILHEKKRELLKNLPFFHEIYNKEKGDSFIRYYEGLEAVKLIYTDLLNEIEPGDDYLVIGNQEKWLSLDKNFFQNFTEKRAKLNIKLRLLFQDSIIAREHKKFERNYNEKVKILPPNTSLSTNMVITPKKVVIHQLSDPIIAIVIENKNISRMNKEMFEIIWNSIPA